MQGKWLQLHEIRERLGLEGNLIISSNSPISLFPVQGSSFKSKYRNDYLLLMTILMPERELSAIKFKDGSTAQMLSYIHRNVCEYIIQNRVLFYQFPYAHPGIPYVAKE